jgi:hypothetical protein
MLFWRTWTAFIVFNWANWLILDAVLCSVVTSMASAISGSTYELSIESLELLLPDLTLSGSTS